MVLTFGLTINESANSLNAAPTSGANYTSLQQGTVWSHARITGSNSL